MPSGALAVLVGDVTGKGLEVAALSAMVRFFVEARSWDSERPGEVLAQTDRAAAVAGCRARASSPPSWASSPTGRCAGPTPGTRRPRSCAPTGEEALKATGVPLGVEAGARYEEHETPFGPGDVLFASTDGLIEARREGSFFGERRLPAVLAEHGRTLARRSSSPSSTARSRRGRRSSTTTSSCSPCARARDPSRGRDRRGLARALRRVHGPGARAARRRLRADRADLRHRGRLRRRRAPRGSSVRGRRGRGVRRPAPARARRRRDQADVRHRAGPRPRPRPRAAGRARAPGGRRTAASACACSRPRSCARRARCTARPATARWGRRDRRAHRPVAGEGDHARSTADEQRARQARHRPADAL